MAGDAIFRCEWGVAVVAAAAAAVLLAVPSRALALDPAFDVNQYAHTAWKVRDGSFKESQLRPDPQPANWRQTACGC
jgi:hypothetical protein